MNNKKRFANLFIEMDLQLFCNDFLYLNHFNLYKTKGANIRYTRGDDLAINS